MVITVSQLVKVQRTSVCGVQSQLYMVHPYCNHSPKAQETSWKRGLEDLKSYILGKLVKTVSTEHARTISQLLQLPTHVLHKIKPVNMPTWVGKEFISPNCRALDSYWLDSKSQFPLEVWDMVG